MKLFVSFASDFFTLQSSTQYYLLVGTGLDLYKTRFGSGSVFDPNSMAFWIESGSKYRTRKSQIRNHILFRAMDPDPHKFAFIYIFRSWIRIRMLNADPDPGGKTCQIKTEKMQENRYGNNCKIIKIYKVNFHNLHCFLLLGDLFCILQRQKTLHKVIFFLAGSGSAFFRQLVLDLH